MLTGQVPVTHCALGAGERVGDSLKNPSDLILYNLMMHWISTCSFITILENFRIITCIFVFFVSRVFSRLLPFQTLGYAQWFSAIKDESSPTNQEL